MAITTAFCTSAKVDLMKGLTNFLLSGGSTIKLALFKTTVTGTYGAASTNYSNITGNSDEASVGGGGTGYSAGGSSLTRVDPTSSGTTAFTDFADLVITLSGASASLASDGAMIYNSTNSNAAISCHAFSGSPSASGNGATFTVQFPAADSSNAIIRLA